MRLRRCWFVIADIHDGWVLTLSGSMHEMEAGRGDVIHMDAAEHLIGLSTGCNVPFFHRSRERAAGSINSR